MALAGALVMTGSGLAYADGAAAAEPAAQVREAHKVRVVSEGGADVRMKPHGNARVVTHVSLGAVIVLGGPRITIGGVLWLHISGGGWVCARDVAPA